MFLNKEVDAYIEKHQKHHDILQRLRRLLNQYPFEEVFKWDMPVYVYKTKNLIALSVFKLHIDLWFFEGALLKDPFGLLRNTQKGKTKAMRQIRFDHISVVNESQLKNLRKWNLQNT